MEYGDLLHSQSKADSLIACIFAHCYSFLMVIDGRKYKSRLLC